MEIRKLEAFCKVVELKSFTRAAQAVFLTQPTVTSHIRDLENELNQKLLDRLGHEVEPTPVGRILYKYADRILKIQIEAVQAVEQYSGNLIGRVTIGSGTIPGTYILPKMIGMFNRKHPAIKTTLTINSSRIIADKVLQRELELGVMGARWKENSLHWTAVFTDELVLTVHSKHPWAQKKQKIFLKDMITQPFIFREPGSGTRKVIAQFLESNGYKETDLLEVAEIGSTVAVKELVKAGAGVSIIPKRALVDDIKSGTLVAVQVTGLKLQRPFYLIQRKNRELSPVAGTFKEYLLTQAAKKVKQI